MSIGVSGSVGVRKGYLTDHGIGVMLIMRGPGGFPGGHVCDALVSQIDLFPTICDLLKIDYPHWLQRDCRGQWHVQWLF